MLSFGNVDLFRAGRSSLGADAAPGHSVLTVRVRLGGQVRAGWHRLKIRSSGTPMALVSIAAHGEHGPFARPIDFPVRRESFAAYLFLSRDVRELRLELRFSAGERPKVAAMLRRIPAAQYLLRSARKGLVQSPATFWRFFRAAPYPVGVLFDFPAPTLSYALWIKAREPRSFERVVARCGAARREGPAISLLMSVAGPGPTQVEQAIGSVRRQTDPHWELCICDGSGRPEVRAALEQAERADSRIKLVRRERLSDAAEGLNAAFGLASGRFVAVLGQEDILAPRAVELSSAYLGSHPDTEILYSDADSIDAGGARSAPYFKPDFSPELLMSYDYLGALTVHRTANVTQAGGWRPGFGAGCGYDLTLRILDQADPARVAHLPAILYHRREGSAARGAQSELGTAEAGRRALQDTLLRRGIAGRVEAVRGQDACRVRYALPAPPPLVSIIVPTRDRADLLSVCIASMLEKTTYPDFEVLVVDNASAEERTRLLLDSYRAVPQLRVLHQPGPFNYADINNKAVEQARGDLLCFLNNDTEIISPDWLDDMVGYACQPGVGCVGAKLYYENDTVQHAGVVLGFRGVASHISLRQPRTAAGYFGRLAVASNFSAVTGACLVVARNVFAEVGGFDAQGLAVSFNDIDLCLRVRDRGYRNVFTPFAELYHYESLSRGPDETPEKRARNELEAEIMRRRYGRALKEDPFYSPNLSLRSDFEPAFD